MRHISLVLVLAFAACGNGEVDADEDGFALGIDCDDGNPDVHPDAAEICDGIDNDCDGLGELNATDAPIWYADADADGYGGEAIVVVECEQPDGFLATAEDCDDLDPDIHPDGLETCNGLDDDCDGLVDTDDDSLDLSGVEVYYADADGDGYGVDDDTAEACEAPAGYAAEAGDCDDQDASLHPETVWYADVDGDGFGAANYTAEACDQPEGFTAEASDCDDLDAAVHPDAIEVCDGIDNDCNDLTDDEDSGVDATTFTTWYADADGDGYGDEADTVETCAMPSGYGEFAGDCDETSTDVNPGMDEECNNGIDDDCSGDAPACGIPDGVASVDTIASYTLSGESSSDYFGRNFVVFDFDGDGYEDVIAGAAGNDDGGSSAGKTYVFLGPIASDISGKSADATWTGSASSDYVGGFLAPAGDVDGDGYDDLLVGTQSSSSSYGSSSDERAWLLNGDATLPTSGAISDVAAEFNGMSSYDDFGRSVSGIGDHDGDGYADIAIGAPDSDPNGSSSGTVYVWHGSTDGFSGSYAGGDADAIWEGPTSSAYLGYTGAIANDVDMDGDGYADLAMGAYNAVAGDYGAVFLEYGASTASSGTMTTGDTDASFSGTGSNDYFGRKVGGGDIDGDGYDELMVWEYYGAADNGALHIFAGDSTRYSGGYSASTDTWLTLEGETTYDYFGRSSDIGDVNGDGEMDLVIGAGGLDGGGNSTTGGVYVFYGSFSSGTLTGADADILLYGAASSDYLGYQASAAADVDGDGVDDVLGGASGASSYAGQIFIAIGGGM